MYTCIHVCMYVSLSLYIYIYICVCTYIYIYIYACVYIYIYIHTYICVYIYIYHPKPKTQRVLDGVPADGRGAEGGVEDPALRHQDLEQ